MNGMFMRLGVWTLIILFLASFWMAVLYMALQVIAKVSG